MQPVERRAVPRVHGRPGDFVSYPGGVAAIRDLSLRGVMLADREPLTPGSPVRMELHLGVEVVSATGIVWRTEADRGMAIQFVDLSPIAQSRLGAYLMQADVVEARRRLTRGSAGAFPSKAPPSIPERRGSAAAPATRLGELLVRRGQLTADQLAALKAEQRVNGESLTDLIVKLRLLSENDIVSVFHHEYRLPIIDLRTIEPTPDALGRVPAELAHRQEVLPIGVAGSTLTIATSDPSNFDGLAAVKFRSGCDLKITIAPRTPLRRAIATFYEASALTA